MPASFGEFREGLQEMTGHSAEKVSVKGCIDEILHWTILEVQLGLRSQSSDSQHSFPSFSSNGIHDVWWRWSAFRIPWNCITKTNGHYLCWLKWTRGCLLGVCWRSLPGGGFLVSRSWTFSGPNVIYLYPDCRYPSYKDDLSFKDLSISVNSLLLLKRTALVGTFQNCDVEQARLSEVQDCAGSVQGLVSFNAKQKAKLIWTQLK